MGRPFDSLAPGSNRQPALRASAGNPWVGVNETLTLSLDSPPVTMELLVLAGGGEAPLMRRGAKSSNHRGSRRPLGPLLGIPPSGCDI